MLTNDKFRKLLYWATIVVAAVSAVLTGLATYFGIVDAEKIAQATGAGTMILGFLSGLFAIKNFTPSNSE